MIETKKVGFSVQKCPIVTIESLNDLTFQFQEIAGRLSEIEAKLEELRMVLQSLVATF